MALSVVIGVRLSSAEAQKLARLAAASGRSKNNVLRQLVASAELRQTENWRAEVKPKEVKVCERR